MGNLTIAALGTRDPHGTPAAPPSTRESEISGLVHLLFQRAREARRPLMGTWKKNYRMLNGKMWSAASEPWRPRPQVPEMWPIIASLNAWLTDQRPIFETIPSASPFTSYHGFYAQLSADMNVVLATNWSEYFGDAELFKALWDVHTYGIAWFKTMWKSHLADGLGDVSFERIDPFTIYPDPFARSMAALSHIIEAKVMTLADLDLAWPGASKRVAAGQWEQVEEAPHRLDATTNSNQPRINLQPMAGGTRSLYRDSNRGGTATELPVVTVLECWLRTSKAEEYTAPDGEKRTRSVVTWRCIVVCGNVVLVDSDASDINAYGSHPYDRLVMFDDGQMFGPCLVELLSPLQESINRRLADIEYNVALMGNPVLVEGRRSASRGKRMTNRPGQRIEADPNEIAWLNPPQMHPQAVSSLLSYYQSRMESISGLSSIVRGFAPNGRNSQGVMDSVQDAAFVRVRATLREIERALKSVGKKMVATIAEFYTEPRLQSIMGSEGQRTIMALKARHFYVQDPSDRDAGRVPMRFNLLADAGSQLATSREARAAQAERLFALGVIDGPEVLKATQWPNWGVVAQRVAQQQAQAGTIGQPPGARQRTRA